jgi:hypothetical protein
VKKCAANFDPKNIEQKKKLGGSFLIRGRINGETKSFRQIKLLQVQ